MPPGSSTTRAGSTLSGPVDSKARIKPTARRTRVRVFVYTDHPVFKSSLGWKLGEFNEIQFVGDAASLGEAIAAVRTEAPGHIDVVIADLRIGDGNAEGVDTVATLVQQLDGMPVVVYSDYHFRSYATRIAAAGATAMVSKADGAQSLATALVSAASGSHGTGNGGTHGAAA